MIKIYSFNQTLYLIDQLSSFKENEHSVFYSIETSTEFIGHYKKINLNQNIKEIYFYNKNLDWLFNEFKKTTHIIEAAGGLVMNNKNEYLFIFRNGKWDLPKGKIEKKESIENAAIREVEEECGVQNIKLLKHLTTTYHTYYMEEKLILKPTYWYLMTSEKNQQLIPQLEEGITDVKWFNKNNLTIILKNTYESIKDVIQLIEH